MLARLVAHDRRTVGTGVLVAITIGAAVWIDLSVLGGIGTAPVLSAAPAASDEPIVVDVVVPTSDAVGDAAPTADATAAPAGPVAATADASPAPAPTLAQIQQAATTAPVPAPSPAPATAAPTTAPRAAAPPTTRAPTTKAPTTTTTTTTARPATTYETVPFDGVGDVVVANHHDGTIEFWSASPEPGWGYRLEKQTPTFIEVEFRRTSGEGEAKMEISLQSNGSLYVKRER